MHFLSLIHTLLYFTATRQASVQGPQCGEESPGEDISKRIIGGDLSRHGQWPWLVSLQVEGKEELAGNQKGSRMGQGDPSIHLCGGTLISRDVIISAAHCFLDGPVKIGGQKTKWRATVGEHNLVKDSSSDFVVEIDSVTLHPEFDSHTMENDIAVVRLKNEVPESKYVREICMPRANEEIPPGTLCSVAGWGHTQLDGEVSDKTQHVYIPIVDNANCSFQYSVFNELGMTEATVSDNKICAGAWGKDSCQFDSGGPLSCKKGSRWVLAGIVSYGMGCGFGFPALYTSVPRYVEWVNKILGGEI